MRCEGWIRPGSFMTLGPRKWEQCENTGIVLLTVVQEGKEETLPACSKCWQDVIDSGIEIVKAEPIKEQK